jgi:16S rRNA (cytidine1402-2'-O)-methyltransferase
MLYIIATPIGNLDDISARAIDTLRSVDFILAEDTRHSKRLMSHYNITTPMKAYHEHNERDKYSSVIESILSGKVVALISDAGTPLISDPGYLLVREAKKSGIKVSPIPGPSALTSAISASGIASDRFSFFGFLPSKQTQRLKVISSITHTDETVVFYESPKRILASALDLRSVIGDERLVCFAKEITKSFETIMTANLPEIIDYLQSQKEHQKGEFVILVSGIDKDKRVKGDKELDKILPILLSEMGASKASKIAAKITGIDKKHCYKRAIDL